MYRIVHMSGKMGPTSSCGFVRYHQYLRGLLSQKPNSYKLGGTSSNVTSEHFPKVRTFIGITTVSWLWENANVPSLFSLEHDTVRGGGGTGPVPPRWPHTSSLVVRGGASTASSHEAVTSPSQLLRTCNPSLSISQERHEHLRLCGAFRDSFFRETDDRVGGITVTVDFSFLKLFWYK